MEDLLHYKELAALFRYPSSDFPEIVKEIQDMLEKNYPAAAAELKPFTDHISSCTEDEREELYTKTFDVQPICYLDLGYVIFGEDYKRGAFLLHMQHEQVRIGNDCGTDLPDNICNILTLLPKTDNRDFVNELAVKILIPGVKKMIAEFEAARIDLKIKVLKKLHKAIIQEDLNQGNVYRNCFACLLSVLEQDFSGISFPSETESTLNLQHHNSFFNKNSTNNLVNNYKLD